MSEVFYAVFIFNNIILQLKKKKNLNSIVQNDGNLENRKTIYLLLFFCFFNISKTYKYTFLETKGIYYVLNNVADRSM